MQNVYDIHNVLIVFPRVFPNDTTFLPKVSNYNVMLIYLSDIGMCAMYARMFNFFKKQNLIPLLCLQKLMISYKTW